MYKMVYKHYFEKSNSAQYCRKLEIAIQNLFMARSFLACKKHRIVTDAIDMPFEKSQTIQYCRYCFLCI